MKAVRLMTMVGLVALLAGLAAAPRARAQEPGPFGKARWVWFPEGNPVEDAPGETRYFRRTVKLPEDREIKKAAFLLTADNSFVLYLGGKQVGTGDDWQKAQSIDLKGKLKKGENLLALAATNEGGPAGWIGILKIEFTQGDPLLVLSDAEWKCSDTRKDKWTEPEFDAKEWKAAKVLGEYGMDPWGTNVELP